MSCSEKSRSGTNRRASRWRTPRIFLLWHKSSLKLKMRRFPTSPSTSSATDQSPSATSSRSKKNSELLKSRWKRRPSSNPPTTSSPSPSCWSSPSSQSTSSTSDQPSREILSEQGVDRASGVRRPTSGVRRPLPAAPKCSKLWGPPDLADAQTSSCSNDHHCF